MSNTLKMDFSVKYEVPCAQWKSICTDPGFVHEGLF